MKYFLYILTICEMVRNAYKFFLQQFICYIYKENFEDNFANSKFQKYMKMFESLLQYTKERNIYFNQELLFKQIRNVHLEHKDCEVHYEESLQVSTCEPSSNEHCLLFLLSLDYESIHQTHHHGDML